ncbi:MAG: hypothetical protein IKZ19_02845 [Clostridia bacterium]|nr:hypothetical protein [Clostridia bacterium]
MKTDYASTAHMNAWLRHPVLGDPSFDTHERIATVCGSEPPFEWTVNGSVYLDRDGTWYCYAGKYGRGYVGCEARARTFRSVDQGKTWEDLGWTLERGFLFEGNKAVTNNTPDLFLIFDEKLNKYVLTYDGSSSDFSWETAHDPSLTTSDGGGAIAIADSPAGPFTRMPRRFLSNRKAFGSCGRWSRFYASCVVPRKEDYVAFILTDSSDYYAWALTAMTSPSLEGPWTLPHMILSCDSPGYYPCPMEFFPVEVRGDRVLAHATSVARNRNYQFTFEADLEKAHMASAWTMTEDGNIFHAHDHPDEFCGIWGQTFHGFFCDGRYIMMYPSKTEEDLGTINIAARPADKPHSDGFAFTAHWAPSVTVLKAAYGKFALEADFTFKGTVDIAFDYKGVLGPNESCSDSEPHQNSLRNYSAVRLCQNTCALVRVEKDGSETVLASLETGEAPKKLRILRNEKGVSLWVNGKEVCGNIAAGLEPGTVGIIAHRHSRLDCGRFEIEGCPEDYCWQWNAVDGILGAGQRMPPAEIYAPGDIPAGDRWYRIENGYGGRGDVWAKWNLWGSDFTLKFKKDPSFGVVGIWADGHFCGSLNLNGEGEGEYSVSGLENGPHGIMVRPVKGGIGILGCTARGGASKD